MTNDPVPPTVGATYLAASGRIWHVRSITARRDRVVMVSDSPDGEHGAIMDITAVLRMIALDAPVEEAFSSDLRPCPDDRAPAHPTRAEIELAAQHRAGH